MGLDWKNGKKGIGKKGTDLFFSIPFFVKQRLTLKRPLTVLSFSVNSTSKLTSATTPAILAPAAPLSILTPPPVTTPSFFTPTIASLLINTGNPQVQTVLALASLQPALFDYPLLLNSFINTGNSQVSLILALLSLQ